MITPVQRKMGASGGKIENYGAECLETVEKGSGLILSTRSSGAPEYKYTAIFACCSHRNAAFVAGY